ncbi:MAG: hypothetical protein CL910_18515 [Deltaproteobacteria bacterium]|nr:hypothetical protein [Deltaproteobacteria bacterium]
MATEPGFLHELIRELHSLPAEKDWPRPVLQRLSSELGDAFVGLARFSQEALDLEQGVWVGIEDEHALAGLSFYPEGLPWLTVFGENPGEFCEFKDQFSADQLQSSPFFEEWLKPAGLLPITSMGSLHPGGPEQLGVMWVVVGRRPFTRGEVGLC